MNYSLVDYGYIFATVAFTVYGQLILKWRMAFHGSFPPTFFERFQFIVQVLLDPWVISSLLAAIVASIVWIVAMTKFELTYAYPFTSLNFVMVLVFSCILLSEPITLQKGMGICFIILGTIICGVKSG